jgi:hypothetical protein
MKPPADVPPPPDIALPAVPMRLIRLFSRAALASAILGCATASQRAYVAPTDETVTTTTEEHSDDPPSHTIYVTNLSTVPITVFSVSLHACQNIKQLCDPTPVKIKVAPGGRAQVMRVTPANPTQAFGYSFGFSWHADSSSTMALATLASSGDSSARARLAAIQRTEANRKLGFRELSRDDFKALATSATSARMLPDSVVLAPGEELNTDRLFIAILDKDNQVLGHTRWYRWMVPGQRYLEVVPPGKLIARYPGRTMLRFALADEAQAALTNKLPEVELPVVIAYRVEAHAPVFTGQAVDADTKAPLKCVRMALEDSAGNIVARDRSGQSGTFFLQAPRPGTYHVRAETRGWSPAYGPAEVAMPDQEKQQIYMIKFTEQLLVTRDMEPELEHAQPTSVTVVPTAPTTRTRAGATSVPVVQGVTLGGTPTMPMLGIMSRVTPGSLWMQFTIDSTGRVDTTSITLPPTATPQERASITSVLPRVRFSPARESGMPVCELQRMQVTFSQR